MSDRYYSLSTCNCLNQWLLERIKERSHGCVLGLDGLGKSTAAKWFAKQMNGNLRVFYHQVHPNRFMQMPPKGVCMIIVDEPYHQESKHLLDLIASTYSEASIIIIGNPVKMPPIQTFWSYGFVDNIFNFPTITLEDSVMVAILLEQKYLGQRSTPWLQGEYRTILEMAEGNISRLETILCQIFTKVREWQSPKGITQIPLILPAAREVLGEQFIRWGRMPW